MKLPLSKESLRLYPLLRFAVVVGILVLVSGCVGAKINLVFHEDGGGYIEMEIVISKRALGLASDSFLRPLPATGAEVNDAFGAVPGAVVEYAVESETTYERIINARIRFDDFNALARSELFPGTGSKLTRFLGRKILNLVVGSQGIAGSDTDPAFEDCGCGTSGNPAGFGDPDEEQAQTLLAGYEIAYTVRTPEPIKSASHGEISEDRMSVTGSYETGDYYYLEKPYTIRIRW